MHVLFIWFMMISFNEVVIRRSTCSSGSVSRGSRMRYLIGHRRSIPISHTVNIHGDLSFGKSHCVLRMSLLILAYVNKFMNINVTYIDFWLPF